MPITGFIAPLSPSFSVSRAISTIELLLILFISISVKFVYSVVFFSLLNIDELPLSLSLTRSLARSLFCLIKNNIESNKHKRIGFNVELEFISKTVVLIKLYGPIYDLKMREKWKNGIPEKLNEEGKGKGRFGLGNL